LVIWYEKKYTNWMNYLGSSEEELKGGIGWSWWYEDDVQDEDLAE